ncbi:hypothetical protein EWU23_09365 [Cytophagaceae bacterium 50C-KIRBA]|uniref:Uncharacterized protein n=1 Tax=Aquirufa beregesia TaxID=2516556 RepID=A0ABX0F4A2_9BACT|nr:hypothetical protein [Aquirufa beregesia]NGZ44685.1 hypothetical protein [Aquirufa beregesia]
MDSAILGALITATGSILVASLAFYLTKRNQLEMDRQQNKVNHYKVLLSSLSDLATDGMDKDEANRRFALASNTVALVAPQSVITALMEFHDEVKFSNPNKSVDKHDELLVKLLYKLEKSRRWKQQKNQLTRYFH